MRRLWILSAVAAAGTFYFFTPLSDSDALRMFIWRAAWDNLKWFGWGPGVFYTILLPQNGVYSLYPEYAHNDALQLVFEYGLGAMLLLPVFGYALWRTDAKEWPVVLAFVAAGCYSMPLFLPITAFLAFVAVGHILRMHGLARSYGGNSRQHVVPEFGDCYAKAG